MKNERELGYSMRKMKEHRMQLMEQAQVSHYHISSYLRCYPVYFYSLLWTTRKNRLPTVLLQLSVTKLLIVYLRTNKVWYLDLQGSFSILMSSMIKYCKVKNLKVCAKMTQKVTVLSSLRKPLNYVSICVLFQGPTEWASCYNFHHVVL
jgi:hypothetical protein